MVKRRQVLPAGVVLSMALAGSAGAQVLTTLVETRTGPAQVALGYPPPLPVDSVAPVAGFRSYASLHARHQDLALRSADLRGQVIGHTGKGRDIWAYVLSDDDDRTASGASEPVLLLNATIHAREWQSPEVATGILERFVESADDAGLVRFLLDEIQVVVIPVFNIDGFLLTQARPKSTYLGQDPEGSMIPREGRLRRKNLREADELFETTADHLYGVDLNRNFPPYFGGNNGSSADRRSLVHRGPAPLSEPESHALVAAADLFGPGRLRLYSDLHSFSQVLFTVRTGRPRTDALTAQIAARFATHHQSISRSPEFPGGRFYGESPDVAGFGTGYTSEYFATRFLVPSWTLEIEPGDNGAQDYGAPGWHHDGFILPDSQISRVRTQLAESHVLLAYHVAGPASLLKLKIFDRDSGQLVASSAWSPRGDGLRERSEAVTGNLGAGGRYRIWLGFDRPMRVFDAAGQAGLLPGQAGLVEPRVKVRDGTAALAVTVSHGTWIDRPGDAIARFDRYRGDAWTADLDLPASSGPLQFLVDTEDAIGRALDGNPATPVDWRDGAWSGYQDDTDSDGDSGGTDASHVLQPTPAPLRFTLQDDAPLRIGEGETVVLPVQVSGELASSASLHVDYGGGLAGPALLALDAGHGLLSVRSVENVDLDGERVGELRASLADGRSVALALRIIDNDTPTERLVLAQTVEDLRLAFTPAVQALSRRVRLSAGADYILPTAADGNSLPEVRGTLYIEGQNARLLAASGARVFDIAADASLQIDQLRIDGGGALGLSGGQLRNRGTLQIRGLDSRGATGACGGAIMSSGKLDMSRSSILGATAVQGAALCVLDGTAQVADSTLQGGHADDGAAIFNRGQTLAVHLTLDSHSSTAGAQLAAPAGQLRLAASVLGRVAGARCSGSVQSLGNNLALGAVCEGPPVASDVILAGSPLLAGVDPRALALTATAPALPATDRDCTGSDQRNTPRTAGQACDFGALERAVAPRHGLWWDRQRSGQGLDIQRAGDGLLVLLYSYDSGGEPITYTAQGHLVGGRFDAELLRWRRAPVSLEPESAATGRLRLQFDTASSATMLIALDGQPDAASAIEPFAFGPEDTPAATRVDLAYGGEARYGVTFADHGGVQVGLVYAYAADQVLRWALADNSEPGPSLRLISFTGACPSCAYRAPLGVAAGTISFRRMGMPQAQLDLQLRLGVGAGGTQTLASAPLSRVD